jgi:hypothetical protein
MWNEIPASLDQVFSGVKPDELLLLAERPARLVELLRPMAFAACGAIRSGLETDQKPTAPIENTEPRRALKRMLKTADDWFAEVAELDDYGLAFLALAAIWDNEEKDGKLARDLTKRLVRRWQDGGDTKFDRDVVYAVYRTHWLGYKGIHEAESLLAARRMIAVANTVDLRLNEPEAKALFFGVLEPTVVFAAKSGDHQYFDALSDFLRSYGNQQWIQNGESGIADRVESLYTTAIKLSDGKITDYYGKRGEARLEKREVNVDGALKDAEAMERLMAGPDSFRLLRGYAYFIRSRQQETTSGKLDDLDLARAELMRLAGFERDSPAPALPPDPAAAAKVALLLSMIHLEHGNYSESSDRRNAFQRAVEYGKLAEIFANKIVVADREKAAEEQLTLLVRSLHAQGIAFEDLAYIAKSDVVGNYDNAINAFRHANRLRESNVSKMHLARSYYRFVIESDLPKDIGPDQRDSELLRIPPKGLLKREAELLERALTDEASWDVASLAEAHHWLGNMYQVMELSENRSANDAKRIMTAENYKSADGHLGRAARLANENGLSNWRRASYQLAWAEHALYDPKFRSTNETVRQSALTELVARTKSLPELALQRTVSFDLNQEARLLEARGNSRFHLDNPLAVLFETETLDEAAKDARNHKKNASRSDVAVIQFRRNLRERIIANDVYRATITKPTSAEDAFLDANWLANLPSGLCDLNDKAAAFDVARIFFGELIKQLPHSELRAKLAYRGRQVECLRRAIEIDPSGAQSSQRYSELSELWRTVHLHDYLRFHAGITDRELPTLIQLTDEAIKLGQNISAMLKAGRKSTKVVDAGTEKLRADLQSLKFKQAKSPVANSSG